MAKREEPDNCDSADLADDPGPQCRASIQWRLAHVGRSLAQRQQATLAAHGLDLRSYATLMGLERAPCVTQLALAKESRVDKSTLVAILDGLEKTGWVERKLDPRDRRARIVCATEAGKIKLVAAHASVSATEDAWLGTLDAKLRQAFLEGLALLAEIE